MIKPQFDRKYLIHSIITLLTSIIVISYIFIYDYNLSRNGNLRQWSLFSYLSIYIMTNLVYFFSSKSNEVSKTSLNDEATLSGEETEVSKLLASVNANNTDKKRRGNTIIYIIILMIIAALYLVLFIMTVYAPVINNITAFYIINLVVLIFIYMERLFYYRLI